MKIPPWSTIAFLVVVVMQFILFWLQAKRTGEPFRGSVLPSALLAVAVSIIFVREFFRDLPVLIDAPIAILCSLLILFVVGLAAVRLKRYLKDAWQLEDQKDK